MSFIDSLPFIGDILGGAADVKNNRKNIAYQKEFAQSGIQWRTDDARAAGVHPLFAMGANTTSFQPGFNTGSAIGDTVRRLGRTAGSYLDKENKKLQNDFIKEQIEASKYRRKADGYGAQQDGIKVLPINMENNPAAVRLEPPTRIVAKSRKDPHKQAGITPPWQKFKIYKDLSIWAPTEELSEMFESPAMWPLVWEENKKELTAWIRRAHGRGVRARSPAMFKSGMAFRKYVARKIKEWKGRKQMSMDPFINRRR